MPSAEYVRKAAYAAKYGTGIVGLWKRGWHEIPEVMGSSMFGLVGLVGLVYIGCKYYVLENKTVRFKEIYTIYRSDDKMLELLQPHIRDASPKPTSTPPGLQHTKFCLDCKPEF